MRSPSTGLRSAERHARHWPKRSVFVAQRVAGSNRACLVQFGAAKCAYFDNQSREALPHAELYNVVELLRTKSCFFSHDESVDPPHNGTTQFAAYQFVDGSVRQRQVSLYKDGPWKFFQTGEPLPFERLDAYQLAKKKDRLTPEILREYGKALDIPFWDEGAYQNDVVLLHWGNQPADEQAAVEAVTRVFGQPSFILDRHGLRRPSP